MSQVESASKSMNLLTSPDEVGFAVPVAAEANRSQRGQIAPERASFALQDGLKSAVVSTGDKHYRSLLKAISWRVTGTIDTIVISFLITGKIKLAVSIGCVEVFTKIGLFYFHERLWGKIPLGRAQPPEDYTI